MLDRSKEFWDAKYKTRPMVAALDFTKKALSHLSATPGASILDIGCGDGRDAIVFAEHGHHVTAIDFSKQAIDRVKKAGQSIDARVMDIANMGFPGESFDAIYAHLSLHYFDDEKTTAIFEKIRHMLKPGGFFFVKCKSTNDPLYGEGENIGPDLYKNPHLRHFFSPQYMKEKLSGWTILELEETTSAYDGKESAFVEAVARR